MSDHSLTSQDPRLPGIRKLLFEYVRSPSLRHLRDPHSVNRLAEDVVRSLGEDRPTWRKWDNNREEFLKSAAHCWVPIEDLRDYLNGMPGPKLTNTDVAQRLQVHYVEPYVSFPNEDLQVGCLAIYEREKGEGTELPAIIGVLQEYIEKEEYRLRIEQQVAREKCIEDERIALESNDSYPARIVNGRPSNDQKSNIAGSMAGPIGFRRRQRKCGTSTA